MKLNERHAILSPRVLLVPYCAHHVPTYHAWMQDEELQKLTASEPLSLGEEYAMQASWRRDVDKLTFIICTSPPSPSSPSPTSCSSSSSSHQPSNSHHRITPGKEDAPENMIGDVNLFLYPSSDNDSDFDSDAASVSQESGNKAVVGELEIMIARPDLRGKGFAKEALRAFIWYVSASLGAMLDEYDSNTEDKRRSHITYLRVKIAQENIRSINLFQGVGFARTGSEANYFGEVELRTQVVGGRLVHVGNMDGMESVASVVEYRL
ncbi:hypothetical protein EJ02DRAFT_454720 [Clathrospora elynae]|uniref:N-acetyltransferase domain-containing protein n=1 Tax=Clathrospora elynae TaxID=706981 RepID=A0A6A5SML0_9PLEO|nr:hypothetical protein EJ02DRAFT_454720 [Clathrospora elynae]